MPPQRSGVGDVLWQSGIKLQQLGHGTNAAHYLTIPQHTVGSDNFSDVKLR